MKSRNTIWGNDLGIGYLHFLTARISLVDIAI